MDTDFYTILREIRRLKDLAASGGLEQNDATGRTVLDLYRAAMSSPAMNRARCFVLEFHGSDAITPTEADLQKAGSLTTPSDVDSFTRGLLERAGAMPAAVEYFLASLGCHISERAAGQNGWILGVYCTPGEAWTLHRASRAKFTAAIESGLVHLEILPWAVDLFDPFDLAAGSRNNPETN